jgi:hypothetical protein
MKELTSILAALRRRFLFTEGAVPHDARDMLHQQGQVPEALLYSLLFVPQLAIVADSVLATFGDKDLEERFLKARAENDWPLDKLEASFNLIEVPYLFSDRSGSDEEDRLLAEQIAQAWRGALAVFSPDRHFVVNVLSPDMNAGIIAVEFFETR